jgi:hypothetical protein
MILLTQGDETEGSEARQYWERRGVATSAGILYNINCICPTTTLVLKILHTIYLRIFMHLMALATYFLEQHSRINKFNQHWALIPPYPGISP